MNRRSTSTLPEIQSSQTATLTIGVRDSGVGGLTVAREIKKRLPHAHLLYFADTAHVPYGDRLPVEVRHYALSITNFLIEHGAQLVVFACNTSSAYALQVAKNKFETPLVGMIEPGARAALAANVSGAPVGVLATNATVQSRMYARWIEGLDSRIACFEVGCPEFVPLVESGQTSTQAARAACEKYLRPLLTRGTKTIVLGCTHFPLLLPMLREVAAEYSSEVVFVDPAQAVAAEVARVAVSLASNQDTCEDRFFVSGDDAGVRSWIETLLHNSTPHIENGPVFDLPVTNRSTQQTEEGVVHATN